MAYTRIHNIKKTLKKALDYIENPKKTDYQMLVSTYNCEPLTASIDFEMTNALAREIKGDYSRVGGTENIAHHMIQSFSPFDKITPEQAHELGRKWADEILQGKYEYVISTHLDKGHIHNHVIFNSTSFYDYSKFENYKIAKHLREISDRLCEEHGLYVIKNPNQQGRSHYEWERRKAGTSWKAQLEFIINKVIKNAADYNEFKSLLAAENVEVKEGKHIAFRLVGQERFCRGKAIGNEFTREKILERIARPKDIKAEPQAPAMAYDKRVEWEANKTKLAKTKELAAALLTIGNENIQSEADFVIKIDDLATKAAEVKGVIKQLDEKNLHYKNAAKFLITFNKYLPIKQDAAKQAPFNRKRYDQKHESELKAFDYAAGQLGKLNVNTNVDPDKVLNLVRDQDRKVSELNMSFKAVEKRIIEIRQAKDIVEKVRQENEKKEPEKRKGRGEIEI